MTGGSPASSYIGYASGSKGVVTVDGDNSTSTDHSDLYVGNTGSGTLSITNHGNVSVAGATYVGSQTASTGAIQFRRRTAER